MSLQTNTNMNLQENKKLVLRKDLIKLFYEIQKDTNRKDLDGMVISFKNKCIYVTDGLFLLKYKIDCQDQNEIGEFLIDGNFLSAINSQNSDVELTFENGAIIARFQNGTVLECKNNPSNHKNSEDFENVLKKSDTSSFPIYISDVVWKKISKLVKYFKSIQITHSEMFNSGRGIFGKAFGQTQNCEFVFAFEVKI
ncbi:MAG: hypothetical protein QXS37_05165 [Candidatus Aenigmatarchaeota archaeon]